MKREINKEMSIDISHHIPLDTYPRMMLRRDSYFPLNGEWEYYLTKEFSYQQKKNTFHKINVPAPFKSSLSGAKENIQSDDLIVYHKKFYIDNDFIKDINILNILGIDNEFSIYLNDVFVGDFVFLNKPLQIELPSLHAGENEIFIITKDNNNSYYPRGKQSLNPKGMFYTSVEGIYFPLFIESVYRGYIKNIKYISSLDRINVQIDSPLPTNIKILENDKIIFEDNFIREIEITITHPRHWSLNNPFLYQVIFENEDDIVYSYFALRTIEVKNNFIYLNNKKIFINGLLDQGYYLDGIVTPKDYGCYYDDILKMKNLGFNLLRKHIKVECDYYYYLCDKLGMLVFQDFVNNGHYSYLKDTVMPTLSLSYQYKAHESRRSFLEKFFFIKSSKNIIKNLESHPCIIAFTIFNEGWGQFESKKVYHFFKKYLPHHILNTVSGWFRKGPSDITALHIYFREIDKVLKKFSHPVLISEFGGYQYRNEDHLYNKNGNYGYKGYQNINEYQEGIYQLYSKVKKYKNSLIGVIYTQVSDVEDEVNGLLTYDRKINKITNKKLITLFKELSDE